MQIWKIARMHDSVIHFILIDTRQAASMIHAASPTTSETLLLFEIWFVLLGFEANDISFCEILKSGDGRTETFSKIMITTGRDSGWVEWINKKEQVSHNPLILTEISASFLINWTVFSVYYSHGKIQKICTQNPIEIYRQ